MNVTEALSGIQAPRTTDARLDQAFDALRDERVSVLSVDIFDTLLWRRVADPVDAFPLVGERLRRDGLLPPAIGPLVFKRLRIEAEARARADASKAGRGTEVSLDEIYTTALPPEQPGPRRNGGGDRGGARAARAGSRPARADPKRA